MNDTMQPERSQAGNSQLCVGSHVGIDVREAFNRKVNELRTAIAEAIGAAIFHGMRVGLDQISRHQAGQHVDRSHRGSGFADGHGSAGRSLGGVDDLADGEDVRNLHLEDFILL